MRIPCKTFLAITLITCSIRTLAFRCSSVGVDLLWASGHLRGRVCRQLNVLCMMTHIMKDEAYDLESTDLASPIRSSSWPWNSPVTRRRAIGLSFLGVTGGLAAAPKSSFALDPLRKTQELWRIRNQEEADNVLGGELASPEGGKTIQPVLTLIPIVTLRLKLDAVDTAVKDPSGFREALMILRSEDFQKKNIKRVFNAYSDNIYYLLDSGRENSYLEGGAVPTTRQTLQYLLRNDVVDSVDALAAEIAYLIREREASASASGSAPTADRSDGTADLDETDMKMYLAKCKESFDRYLGMVYQSEIDEATEYAKMALNTGKTK